MTEPATPPPPAEVSLKEIFWYFLKLGWLAFGAATLNVPRAALQLGVPSLFGVRVSALVE